MPFTILRTLHEFLLFPPPPCRVPCLVRNLIKNPIWPLVVMPPSSLPVWDSSSVLLPHFWFVPCFETRLSSSLLNALQFGSVWYLFSHDWKGPECHRRAPWSIISGGTQGVFSLSASAIMFLLKPTPPFLRTT